MSLIDRIPMKESIKINFKRYIYDLTEDDSISVEIIHVKRDGSESVHFMPERDITIEEAWLNVVKSLFPGANIMVEDEYIDGCVYPEEEEDTNE